MKGGAVWLITESEEKNQYKCLYCSKISKSEIIYLNVAHFVVMVNGKYCINGETATLIEHFKKCSLHIDFRTIGKIVDDDNKKCYSRLICEDLVTWMYQYRSDGWPYEDLNLELVEIRKVKVTGRQISRRLGGKKKTLKNYVENADGTYSLRDNMLDQLGEMKIRRFLKIALDNKE